MITPYLIEIRLMGETKHITRKLVYDIFHKFHVKGQMRKRPVPHVTLFGPFSTRSIRQVIHCIKEEGSEYQELGFEVDGFDYFESKKWFSFLIGSSRKNVIYLKIKPSEELKDFRRKLAKKLVKITHTISEHDTKSKYHFHATLAMKDIDRKFEKIWEYLKNYEIKTKGVCYRITLLKDAKIMYEYELSTGRMLNRSQALRKKTKR